MAHMRTSSSEDNALRVLFLEEEYCLRFALAHDPTCVTAIMKKLKELRLASIATRTKYMEHVRAHPHAFHADDHLSDENELNKRLNLKWKLHIRRDFECDGADVALHVSIDPVEFHHPLDVARRNIHLRAAVGDDYPEVLRHIRKNHCNTLFLVQYNGTGATEEQFIRTFEAGGKIKVIFKREVDATSIPPNTAMEGIIDEAATTC